MTGHDATPVTVIGGYLGAGKTTLINHLLRNANGKRLAILVNEFGELSIDEDLIEAKDDDIISLSGGCVCCSYGNDLFMAMSEMAGLDPRPDHIVLEASGVALPGAIAGSVSLLPDYCVEGVVVLADCETVRERARDKFMGDTIRRQMGQADIILLNKTDLVSADERQALHGWLGGQAAHAVLVETSQAKVDPAVVLSAFVRTEGDADHEHTHHGHTHHGHTHNETRLKSFVVIPPDASDAADLAGELMARNPGLIRAKGFVRAANGTMQALQIVGRRFNVSPAPDDTNPGVVVICLPGA